MAEPLLAGVSVYGHSSQWTRVTSKLLVAVEHNTDHSLFFLGVTGEMARKFPGRGAVKS